MPVGTSPFHNIDVMFEIAKGNVPGHLGVNKFGRNPDIDTGTTPEDVHGGGGIWVPPTQARIHNIASDDANDTAAGTGARTMVVSGLTDWDTPEVSEILSLDGLTDVATANAYVIIHRKKALTFGSGRTNAGNITATAVTDGTVTARINAGKGQTQMAIYGLPSCQVFLLQKWERNLNNIAAAANSVDLELRVNERPDQADSGFVVKRSKGLYGAGTSGDDNEFKPALYFPGPAIIKVTVVSVSANGSDVDSGFDGVLVDK